MPVPLLDIQRQHAPLAPEFNEAFNRILESGAFILGKEVQAFEASMAEYIGVKHAIGVSSGTDALLVALMALDIGQGDEVLCPAFTFFGTAGSIARLGATPVWVDVDRESFNIDLEDAARKLSAKTKAMMPVHLFGQACDMDAMTTFAKEHGLAVIEDAAQAIGAEFKGKQVGGFTELGAFSFYPTKNLGGLGDGGLVTTNDDVLAEKVIKLRNHGMHPKYVHQLIGGNFRLDALQAAFLDIKLKYLDKWHEARGQHAAAYREALKDCGAFELPAILPYRRHVWNQFTLKVLDGRRDELRNYLNAKGIGSEIYYPIALDQQACFSSNCRGGGSIRVSHELAASVLSIPVFPELTVAERDEVIEALKQF
ncbi:MAG: DegT/DnrJ/EryC1/StrS family aminotransferase [Opitutales bacterium]|nr:DegT/DnrJ/EryC1/StrS family aminotransferase [Opitutales bacterium]